MLEQFFKSYCAYIIITLFFLLNFSALTADAAKNQDINKNALFSRERIIVKKKSADSRVMNFSAPLSDSYLGIEIEEIKTLKRRKARMRKLPLIDEQGGDGDILVLTLKNKGKDAVLSAVETLNKSPDIIYAEPDYIRTPAKTPDNAYYNLQYNMNIIDAPTAWDVTVGNLSSPILVGVIDSGVNINHEELADNIWVNPNDGLNGSDDDNNGYIDDINGWNFTDNSNDVSDTYGHGTHVAGIIGAKGNNQIGVAGVIWNVKIVPLKIFTYIFDPDTNQTIYGAYDDWVISALEYANLMGITITNNSYSGDEYSQALEEAVAGSGLFVTAAGNYISTDPQEYRNNDDYPSYPADFDCPNIISVANTTADDKLSTTSNYGALSVDIAAPGNLIYSTTTNGGYGYKSGTSMACPHVTGAAALLKSYDENLTAEQLKSRILDYADRLPSLSGFVADGRRLSLSGIFTPYFVDENEQFNTRISIYQNQALKSDEIEREDAKISVYMGNNSLNKTDFIFIAAVYNNDTLVELINLKNGAVSAKNINVFDFTISKDKFLTANKIKFFTFGGLDGLIPLNAPRAAEITSIRNSIAVKV